MRNAESRKGNRHALRLFPLPFCILHFVKAHRVAITSIAIAVGMPAIAAACPVCFGNPAAPMNKGTASAIWFLLGIVGFVQAGFVALFFTFWKRARDLKKRRESFAVIDGGGAR